MNSAVVSLRRCLALALTGVALAAPALHSATPAIAPAYTGAAPKVTLEQNAQTWTLSNGIISIVVNKTTGNTLSLEYKGADRLGHEQGQPGVWEQNPSAAAQVNGLTNSVTIDPAKNGGEFAEVSVKGVTRGEVGLSPGAPGAPSGGTRMDMEIRYALGRGDSGYYTYAIFTHPAGYPAGGLGSESRYILRPSQAFDWLSVDFDRNMLQAAPRDWGTGVVVHAKEQRIMSQGVYKNSVEHKYSYNAVQYTIPAYGWSSTKDKIGLWFINPSMEYLSGGPTKMELVCHFGDNANPTPIILNYWKGSHYGSTALTVAANEDWSRVVGPMFIYVNSLDKFETPTQADLDKLAATAGDPSVPKAWKDNATALWQDALAEAKKQAAKWPYAWVQGVDYPKKHERGTVQGQIALHDPFGPTPAGQFTGLMVGLSHPDYTQGGGFGGNRVVDWAYDAKYYQFWNNGATDGTFTIPNVRPGNYTLHAFATGVLGEYAKADITVEAGKTLDLGKLQWEPVRYGRQVWEIGYPDRTGGKFFKGDGDNYWLWGWGLRYPLLFPNDVDYTVGKSDYRKDWFFQQTPRSNSTAWINPEAKDPANQRFGWIKAESLEQYPQTDTQGPWRIYGRGEACTWTIRFNLEAAPRGSASLRVSLAGANGAGPTVAVNGRTVGVVGGNDSRVNAALLRTDALRYNTNKSVWQERTVTFDASLLKQGENVMTLTIPAGEVTSGVVYDYLRLEVNESYNVDGTPITAAVAR